MTPYTEQRSPSSGGSEQVQGVYCTVAAESFADLLTAMRANSAKSPAVRFFTMHTMDDKPWLRAESMNYLIGKLREGALRPLIEKLPRFRQRLGSRAADGAGTAADHGGESARPRLQREAAVRADAIRQCPLKGSVRAG